MAMNTIKKCFCIKRDVFKDWDYIGVLDFYYSHKQVLLI